MKLAIEEWGLYNQGVLVCRWWDTETADIEEIKEYYLYLRKKEDPTGLYLNHEDVELFIADADGDDLNIAQEYGNIGEIIETYQEFENFYDDEKAKLSFLMDCQGYDFKTAQDKIDDCQYFPNYSFTELAEEFVEQGLFGEIPDSIQNYINYDAIARDLELDYTEYNGSIFRGD